MSDNYSVKKHHDKELQEIFKRFSQSDSVCSRGLVSQDLIQKNSIVFIGINPSYSNNAYYNKPTNYYNLLQNGNLYRKYFGRFEEISEKTNLKWTHLDLLYFQHTNQKHVNYYISNTINGKEFISNQLDITRQILNKISPKIIVISNALARDLFGSKYDIGLKFEHFFDNTIGTHIIKSENPDLNNTPLFLTSMLTGVRALDNGSFERLIWHINKIKNNYP